MKKIDTSKLMEVKLRIYSYGTIERLSKCFEKHRTDFRNKNEFLVYVITNGLDILELQDENFKDYYQKMESISEKITHFENHLSVKEDMYIQDLKMINVQQTLIEKLLSRIYNLVLAHDDERTLQARYVEAGMYDRLPEGLQELKNEYLKAIGIEEDKNGDWNR